MTQSAMRMNMAGSRPNQQDAQKLGVEGTPYFLVNNMVVRGALPLDLFKGAVDMALKQNNK